MYAYSEDDDMKLPKDLAELFYDMRNGLLWEINERHKIIKGFDKPSGGTETLLSVTAEQFLEVRKAMWENPQWIDEYLADDQDASLTQEKRDIISDWRKYFIKSGFILVKHLSKYSVFMIGKETLKLYGVHALVYSLEDLFPVVPQLLFDVVLLPFKDRIVYDGLAEAPQMIIEPEKRLRILEMYNALKDAYGIIEKLDGENLGVKKPTSKIPKKKKSRRWG
jgi:hypothetical protein